VSGLGANSGDWNLALDAQGHIQGDLYVWREDPGWSSKKPASVAESHDSSPRRQEPAAGEIGLDVEMAADQHEKLLAHLERFIIMDDVELVPLDGESALGLTGPLAAEVLGRLGLPVLAEPLTAAHVEWNSVDLRIVRSYGVLVPHYEIWAPLPRLAKVWKALRIAGATPVGTGAVAALRVAEGIPAYGIDMVEQDLPQETSQMRAISFNKGCYLGQEVVERIRSRSSVHRHLRPLELFGPVPANGTELSMPDNSEKEAVTGKGEAATAAGQITSAAELQLSASHRVFALAMIRDEAEQRSKTFMYTDGTATGMAHILAATPSFETGTAS
jgi:folate-binding protein YgfZ